MINLQKFREHITYDNFIKYSRTINGRLQIKLFSLFLILGMVQIGIVFIYFGQASLRIQEGMKNYNDDHLAVSEQITSVILSKVSDYFMNLVLLASLLGSDVSNTNNLRMPVTIQNITYSNDSFTNRYQRENNMHDGKQISLNQSIYQSFGQMTAQAWSTTVQFAQIDDFIVDFMNYYDTQFQFFKKFYIVNKRDQIIHQFPVIDITIDVKLLNITQVRQMLYSQEEITLVLPISIGVVVGIGKYSYFQMFVDQLESPYHIEIRNNDNTFNINNFKDNNDKCACQVEYLLGQNQVCNPGDVTKEYYYSNLDCMSLYFRKISTELSRETSVYLIIYRSQSEYKDSLQFLLDYSWPFYICTVLQLAYLLIMLISYINKFTRDITNPIKQITYKIDKVINNVFHVRIISRIQADDILIREETEVQQLVSDFSNLFETLRNENCFNIPNNDTKVAKEILIKQPDKTMEQIKLFVQKFKDQ